MRLKKWLKLFSFVLLIIGLFAGYYLYSMFSFLGSVNANKPFSTGENPLTTAKWEGTERVNILFIGVDSRNPDERPRSDTMLLASLDPVSKQVALFSIMRDTYVDIPGYGQHKINAAFANGGPELLIETIQKFLNTKIHYYVATDFNGFVKIVDSIGGIDVNVKEDMVHADDGVNDINLKAGQQHLNGHQALQYVRYRGGLRADFERTERQREVVKLVANEMKSPGNLIKLPSILHEIKPYIQTNLGGDDLWRLAALGLNLDTANMKTEQLPPDTALQETTNRYGEAILLPDIEATRAHFRRTIQSTDEGDGNRSGTKQTAQPKTEGGNATPTQGKKNQQPNSQKPSEPAVTVTGEYVNVRSKPGTDSAVIGQVYAGQILTVLDQLGDWYYIRTPDGMLGYVSASLVKKN
jgi:LCP family protein required for cell wall assembly